MQRDFKSIANKDYDVIVVGGGIVGAGVARDTTLRGLNTLLLEKEDFGYGTTSRSTRLIHGGLRYLRQLEFGLVRQDLSEREVLLRIAPHLVHPLTFLIPISSTFFNFVMLMGVILYDLISFDKTLPNHKYLNKKKTLEQEPGMKVNNLQGSYVYYDCQVPYPERLNLETALSAAENGATVVNHARVTKLLKEGNRITGVEVRDEISGETLQAKGKLVVNAAGHWVDQVKEMVFQNKPPYLLRTKGIHIIIPKVSNNALVLFSPTDSRLFFVIPWEGFSLVGTTDTVYTDNLDAVCATNEDVKYLVEGLHLAYPDVKIEDVYYTTAGLRSLALKPGKKASDTSRSHELIDHKKKDSLEGMVTILGGKITAYRAVARDAADMVSRKLGNKARCTTGNNTLPGAPALGQEEIDWLVKKECLPEEVITNLAHLYGSRCRKVLDLIKQDERGKNQIISGGPDIIAQIWYAVKEEYCLTVSDFMIRRSALGFRKDQGIDAAKVVATEMKGMLNWSEAELSHQTEDYMKAVALTKQFDHA
jgi:glycerol-3-phosphate dehydrogenase